MEEIEWMRVSLYLSGRALTLNVSMTKKELDELKDIKLQGQNYYFQTTHPQSDRLLVDVTEIIAITEFSDLGDG